MKTPAKILLSFAATCFALFGTARAQLQTYTTQTLSYWGGSILAFQPSLGEDTLGQTFTNVGKINSLTYTFLSASPTPTTGTLSYTFGQWNSSTGTFTSVLGTGSLTISSSDFSTALVRGSNTYYADLVTFDGSNNLDLSQYTLSPSSTYALLFTSTVDEGFGLGTVPGNKFSYGTSYDAAGALGASADYAFSYISVDVPPTYVPESGTIASLLAVALVAGLMGYRVYQRRKQALMPVAVAAGA